MDAKRGYQELRLCHLAQCGVLEGSRVGQLVRELQDPQLQAHVGVGQLHNLLEDAAQIRMKSLRAEILHTPSRLKHNYMSVYAP